MPCTQLNLRRRSMAQLGLVLLAAVLAVVGQPAAAQTGEVIPPTHHLSGPFYGALAANIACEMEILIQRRGSPKTVSALALGQRCLKVAGRWELREDGPTTAYTRPLVLLVLTKITVSADPFAPPAPPNLRSRIAADEARARSQIQAYVQNDMPGLLVRAFNDSNIDLSAPGVITPAYVEQVRAARTDSIDVAMLAPLKARKVDFLVRIAAAPTTTYLPAYGAWSLVGNFTAEVIDVDSTALRSTGYIRVAMPMMTPVPQ